VFVDELTEVPADAQVCSPRMACPNRCPPSPRRGLTYLDATCPCPSASRGGAALRDGGPTTGHIDDRHAAIPRYKAPWANAARAVQLVQSAEEPGGQPANPDGWRSSPRPPYRDDTAEIVAILRDASPTSKAEHEYLLRHHHRQER